MVFYLTLIFSCQLIGEIIITATGLPVPGPIVGMGVLFVGLLVRGSLPDELAATANTLLANLSLLFVPAGVGVMLHAEVIKAEIIPISIALVISTLLAVGVTALVMSWLRPADGPADTPAPSKEA